MQETRQQIMDAVIDQFNKKGMKFTMDDISKELHISKKTIYKEFYDNGWKTYIDMDRHGWVADPEHAYYDSIYQTDINWWK